MTYAYTLLVKLPPGRHLGTDDEAIDIPWKGRTVTVKAMGETVPIRDADWLKFASTGFVSSDDAERHGRSFKGHLRLAAVRSHLPIDVGRDRVHSAVSHQLAGEIKATHGVQILPSVHGLLVYEQTVEDRVFWSSADALARVPVDRFLAGLESVADMQPAHDDSRLALACDLYAQALFETSQTAQFISLVTAIEALIVRNPLPPAVLDALKGAEALLETQLRALQPELDHSSLRSLSGRIRDLRKESISRAFRTLADARGNPDGYGEFGSSGQFAATVYSLRSRLVHGEAVTDALPVAHLMLLVSDIILATADNKI